MNRRIVSFLMTLLSYVAVYRLFRYLSDRFFGQENQQGYKRVAATFATLVLTPRFRYNNEEGQDAIELRWPLLRRYKKLFSFPKKKDRTQDLESAGETDPIEGTADTPGAEDQESGPQNRRESFKSSAVNGENIDSAPLSDN